MKKTIQATLIGLVILAAGAAAAADSATVNVSAQVVGTCRFNTASTNLAFGSLPFDGAGNALGTAASATLTFWCTNGASYTITDDSGLYETAPGARRMQSNTVLPAEFIAYGLSYAPATGTGAGPGAPITLTLNGTVGATYTANSPDAYSDTVTVNIVP